MSRCLKFVIFLSTLALPLSAQTSPTMINSKDAPLKFETERSTLDDMMQTIVTKNVSDKKIVSFRLGLIMSVPVGCGPKEVFGAEQLMPLDRTSVKPNEEASTYSYRVAPQDLQAFGQRYASKNVFAQIAIVHIDFADGTSWSLSRTTPIYDMRQNSDQAKVSCVKPETAAVKTP